MEKTCSISVRCTSNYTFYIFDEFKFLAFQDDFIMDFVIGYIVFVLIISYILKTFVLKEN